MIEDHWIDMRSYYVVFLTNKNIRIKKVLFFTLTQIENQKISNIIKRNFYNVKEVLSIEEIDEGLFLRNFM